ncbi:MAG: hypothetical protein V1704_03475 [Candidatus Vogelbacteria bacterium]
MAQWSMNRGSATSDLWWFVAIMIALWILWYATGGPSRPEAWRGPFIEPPAPISTGEIYGASLDESRRADHANSSSPRATTPTTPSPDSQPSGWEEKPLVSINAGNGAYEIQPGKEYIELTASYSNLAPVNITGWQLVNNPARHNPVSVAVIPSAVKLFTSAGASTWGPIILRPGDRAVVVTGRPLARSGWPIQQSFRFNKCVGYLDEEFRTADITPSLRTRCPRPADEPGVATLPDKCYDFVRYLPSCHEPEFKEDSEGVDRVDGQIDNLTRQCRLYIQDHFNYNSCVKWHEQDTDFYGDEWRVYLNRTWEMWTENRETITLYDQSGKIVAEESY